MSTGRIHAILIAARSGAVVYERFYDRLSELDKGELRAAFQIAASAVSHQLVADQEHSGVFR